MLILEGLSKSFGETRVFHDVSLTLAPGEFVALLGESGVGKSTLLNCIAGLDTRRRAAVYVVDGTDLATLREAGRARLRRAHLGFVFQAFHVLPHLTVAENVAPAAAAAGPARAETSARVHALLDAVGLGGLGARLPAQLSGGQLQRVAIARAVVHAPALILADEPTGNLDPETAERVLGVLLAQVRERRRGLPAGHAFGRRGGARRPRAAAHGARRPRAMSARRHARRCLALVAASGGTTLAPRRRAAGGGAGRGAGVFGAPDQQLGAGRVLGRGALGQRRARPQRCAASATASTKRCTSASRPTQRWRVASPVLEVDTYVPRAGRRPRRRARARHRRAGGGAAGAGLLPRPAAGEDRLAFLDPAPVFLNAAARDRCGAADGQTLELQSGPGLADAARGRQRGRRRPAAGGDGHRRRAGAFRHGRPPLAHRPAAGARHRPRGAAGAAGAAARRARRWRPTRPSSACRTCRAPTASTSPCWRWWRCSSAPSWCSRWSRCRWRSARRRFALLGVLGLTARERRGLVLAECALLGAAGSLLGLLLGSGMAAAALRLLAGDLGGGYFPGIAPTAAVRRCVGALVFGLLGTASALVGGWWPARQAEQLSPRRWRSRAWARPGGTAPPAWPGLALLALRRRAGVRAADRRPAAGGLRRGGGAAVRRRRAGAGRRACAAAPRVPPPRHAAGAAGAAARALPAPHRHRRGGRRGGQPGAVGGADGDGGELPRVGVSDVAGQRAAGRPVRAQRRHQRHRPTRPGCRPTSCARRGAAARRAARAGCARALAAAGPGAAGGDADRARPLADPAARAAAGRRAACRARPGEVGVFVSEAMVALYGAAARHA